jgi:hypothetical protein
MTRLTFDPATLATLRSVSEPVEVCDETGQLLGYYHPLSQANGSLRSPFSREELERRRQQRTGRTLDQILPTLGQP